MKIFIIVTIFAIGIISITSAYAGWFSSCAGASNEPRPEWVSKPDYSLQGYYVGVGSANKYNGSMQGLSKEEQIKISEYHAKALLVQEIEVRISTENNQNTKVNGLNVMQHEQSKIMVSAEEELRGLKTKARWLDPETCTQYTLMVINKDSVKQAKREKLMKSRLELFNEKLAEGEDREKNRDINVRYKYLQEARAVLVDIDFTVLQEAEQGKVYAKRMSDALARMDKELAQVKGRMAVVAFNEDGTLRANVMGKILDEFMAKESAVDRLLEECSTDEKCINQASDMGFSKLALLRASSQIVMSQMGALKGTLSITRTVYDIEAQRKQIQQTVSVQIMGWRNEDLDWIAAAKKAMQGLN